jgi:hypothetical protein
MAAWYEDYLASAHWQRTRIKKLLAADINDQWSLIRCERTGCGLYVPLQAINIHHITYKRVGKERPEDLAVFCRSCHGVEHGFEPRQWWKACKQRNATMVFAPTINQDRHLKHIGDALLECLAYYEEYQPMPKRPQEAL